MFNLIAFVDPWSEVSPNSSLKHLQHECEEGPRKGCVPTPLGRFVANKGMLCLYLQKLSKPSEYPLEARAKLRTEHTTLVSSSVFLIRSRPARGTCVSSTPQLAGRWPVRRGGTYLLSENHLECSLRSGDELTKNRAYNELSFYITLSDSFE